MLKSIGIHERLDPAMELRNPFTAHPATVSETYTEHLRFASATGFWMILGGLACVLHGLFPFTCTTVGSRTIRRLHDRLSDGHRQPVMERIRSGAISAERA
jgi:hypothetical protein